MKAPDIIAAIHPVVDAFENLGIRYYIGGSVASSAYGIARATLDVDIISAICSEHVHSLVRILKASYYIDKAMILDAIHRCSSFNIIHLETMIKIDIFILQDNPYQKESFKRRREDTLDEEWEDAKFYIASPEDIILNKLDWYHSGGEVSERQWLDVLGVLKVQRDSLKMDYLRRWASELGILDLLGKAFLDAGIG